MSILSKVLPFLFEQSDPIPLSPEKLAALPPAQKQELIQHRGTPAAVLAGLVNDSDTDVRVLLAGRLASLLDKLHTHDERTAQLLTDAIRQLTEDSVTPVRIALASALKDVARTPSAIARKLADDAEREVAEPIIRYSLSLSDEDLLALVTQYPQGWHTQTIASRPRLSSSIMDAVIKTGNMMAGQALLANDKAKISNDALVILQQNPELVQAISDRNSLKRKLKRDVSLVVERSLYVFLRKNAHLDRATTYDVLRKMQQRVDAQDDLPNTPPEILTEEQLKDAILLGQTEIVLKAFSLRAKISEANVKRMLIDSGSAKSVIALCVKANYSMQFAVVCQQRLARLPPDKIFYPLDGSGIPISAEEIKWQWDFFGI
jgi:uncharacterized protein (DUF2336 family)